MGDTAVAIVLMTTEPGKEVEIIDQVKSIKEVKEAMVLFGEFDIFLKLECPDYGLLSSIVVNRDKKHRRRRDYNDYDSNTLIL